jgi:hypothetical protein
MHPPIRDDVTCAKIEDEPRAADPRGLARLAEESRALRDGGPTIVGRASGICRAGV